MKRVMKMVAIVCLINSYTSNCCNHIHSKECGKNNIHCKHQCNNVKPYQEENPRL